MCRLLQQWKGLKERNTEDLRSTVSGTSNRNTFERSGFSKAEYQTTAVTHFD